MAPGSQLSSSCGHRTRSPWYAAWNKVRPDRGTGLRHATHRPGKDARRARKNSAKALWHQGTAEKERKGKEAGKGRRQGSRRRGHGRRRSQKARGRKSRSDEAGSQGEICPSEAPREARRPGISWQERCLRQEEARPQVARQFACPIYPVGSLYVIPLRPVSHPEEAHWDAALSAAKSFCCTSLIMSPSALVRNVPYTVTSRGDPVEEDSDEHEGTSKRRGIGAG